jgi:hypothetical protein
VKLATRIFHNIATFQTKASEGHKETSLGFVSAMRLVKIRNKAKKTSIQAGAKVVFTAGPLSVVAEANVNVARENIEANTKTAIK